MSKITAADFHQMRERTARAIDPAKAQAADAAKADKFAAGQERELSRQFCAYLTQRGVPHIVARTDRKSTIADGWPDVTAMWGHNNLGANYPLVCCVELKVTNGRLSDAQIRCQIELKAAGIPVATCYNLQDAIAFVRQHLCL